MPVIAADCRLEEGYRFDPTLGPLSLGACSRQRELRKCPVVVFYGTKASTCPVNRVIFQCISSHLMSFDVI